MTAADLFRGLTAAKMTQAELAAAIGVDRRQVVRWVCNERPIPESRVPAIRAALAKQPVPLTRRDRQEAAELLDHLARTDRTRDGRRARRLRDKLLAGVRVAVVIGLLALLGCRGELTAPPPTARPGCIYTDTAVTPAGLLILRGIFLDPARCQQLADSFPNNTRPR